MVGRDSIVSVKRLSTVKSVVGLRENPYQQPRSQILFFFSRYIMIHLLKFEIKEVLTK